MVPGWASTLALVTQCQSSNLFNLHPKFVQVAGAADALATLRSLSADA